jgi:hypothetical protein
VVAYYRDLAGRRNWPDSVIAAFHESVEYYRKLDESQSQRSWWQAANETGRPLLFEAVGASDVLTVVKQVEVERDGTRHCYSWRCLEDEFSFLATATIAPSREPFEPISEDVFLAAWCDE